MKNSVMIFFTFITQLLFPGIKETFSDGNFTINPVWIGTVADFNVNSNFQLQSSASQAGTFALFTASEAVQRALWECHFKFDYPTSSSNFACFYLITDSSTLQNGFNGYFVQAGNTNDEISLYCQQGLKKTKIIDGTDKRTDGKPVDIIVRITRDSTGLFCLFSKTSNEQDFIKEGEVTDNQFTRSNFCGISYTCTATTGNTYFFDDITVEGEAVPDIIRPQWLSIRLENQDKMKLKFSEPVVPKNFKLFYNQQEVNVDRLEMLNRDSDMLLQPAYLPAKWESHEISVSGVFDFSGNALMDNTQKLILSEFPVPGELYFNEIMFNPADSSSEYVELYNLTDKLLELTGMILVTRKTDGSLNTGVKIKTTTYLKPHAYLVLTGDEAILRRFHQIPDSAYITSMNWYTLNNEGGSLLLMNHLKDTIYDEINWNENQHHVLLRNTKGISLEKIFQELPSGPKNNWHSCSTEQTGGTPGMKNSQYMSGLTINQDEILPESDFFTPDNDGVLDNFIIRYNFKENGFVANLKVFSNSGEEILSLANNELLSASGYFVWDGSAKDNKIASPGVYIIVAEVFQPLSGIKHRVKIPVALTCR